MIYTQITKYLCMMPGIFVHDVKTKIIRRLLVRIIEIQTTDRHYELCTDQLTIDKKEMRIDRQTQKKKQMIFYVNEMNPVKYFV